MTAKKNQKRSQELAVQIQENEAIYNKQLQESKRIIDLQNKEYEFQVAQSITAQSNLGRTKAQQVEKAGKILERYKLVDKERISTKLSKDFKGYIDPSTVRDVCSPLGWTLKSNQRPGNAGPKQRADFLAKQGQQQSLTPLTPQEKQYIEAHEREIIQDKLISKLVYEWTNKDTADQGRIIDKTPKGTHWSKLLVEESIDYMRETAYKMTPTALHGRLEDIRIIRNLADKLGDVLYEVYETRKKTEELGGV